MPYLTSMPTSPLRSSIAGECRPVGRHAADHVRLDLEIAARRRRLEAHQGPGRRDAKDAGRAAPAAGRDRQPRQVDPLVLAPDGAPELDAPDIRRLRTVAQGLERDLHLQRPAAVEAAGPHVPDRVPVAVRIALVRELLVGAGTERIRIEVEAVAAVVEGVEEDGESVVLAELVGVAAHLVGDPLALGRGVPDPRGDVDVRLVEQDPRLGPLGRGRADVGHLLDEAGDGRHRRVDRLVEDAVEPDGFVETNRPHRRAPLLVACHHGRGDGRGRAVDEFRRRARRLGARLGQCGRRRDECGGQCGNKKSWGDAHHAKRIVAQVRIDCPRGKLWKPPGRSIIAATGGAS